MHYYFDDLFGNYIYDSVLNDTANISDAFFHAAKENRIDLNNETIRTEYEELQQRGFFPEKRTLLNTRISIMRILYLNESYRKSQFRLHRHVISDVSTV